MDEMKAHNKKLFPRERKNIAFNKFSDKKPYTTSEMATSSSNSSELLQAGIKNSNQEV